MPTLIASKASWSGRGWAGSLSLQVDSYTRQCDYSGDLVSLYARHHHEPVLEVNGLRYVSAWVDEEQREDIRRCVRQ